MRKITNLTLIIFSLLISCKKSNSSSGNAALNVIHAVVNVDNISVNSAVIPVPYYQNQIFIGFGSSAEYSLTSGVNPISIISSDDTTKTLFSGNFDLKAGGIYSFYLSGQSSQVDTSFLQDIIPIIKDSSAGVRFINLSKGSQPISINLQGNLPSQAEFSDLGYKQISSFKNYTANSSTSGTYTFEVREQATGSLLTDFVWSYTLHKNNTLVISGSEKPASNTPINVFSINNF